MWSACSFTSFLAELPISPAQIQVLIWTLVAAVIVGGLGSANALLNIIKYFRGDPPASQRYASKEDLDKALGEIQKVEARNSAAITRLEASSVREHKESRETMDEIFDRLDAMNRSLGRIEGVLSKQ